MDAGAAIGVDIGSFKSVLAAVKKRGIDIVLSDSSSKSTPTLCAYTDEERLIGDAGMNQMKKNFANTLQFFPRFLGLNTDCADQIKEEEKYITYKLVPLENKKIGFSINDRGQNHIFTPEQVLAFYFRRIKKFFENDNILSKDIVVSVPSYFSNVERQAVLDALEIAHLKPLRLINESTAVGLTYGFFRKADLPEKDPARFVVFVDLGHSKLTVTIASFLQGKMRIVCHHSDRNLGARNMDNLLLELLAEDFTKKYGADPRKNVRARLRMLDVIEKQRKILSANLEATIHLESLMNDEDLHKNIKRTEFEELIAPLIEKFSLVCKEALAKSGLAKEQIHSVEMVGEATRIPIIAEKCKEIFGVENVMRTLNSLEAVARGCSLQAAMLSPLFKVADYEVQEFNAVPISISYQFMNAGEQKVVTKELFPVGSSFPSTKTITFDNKKGAMDLLVHYSNGVQLLQGLPTQIAQYKIKEVNPKHEKFATILRVSNNIHQVAGLESAELQEEWEEDVKIPVKKDTPATAKPADQPAAGDQPAAAGEEQKADAAEAPQQEYEIKKKHKKTTTPIDVETQAHALPPAVRKQFKDLENQLFQQDQNILDHKRYKNELESLAYDIKNNISPYGPLERYIDEQSRNTTLQQIEEAINWLYGEGANAPIQQYQEKVAHFKKIGDPLKERFRFYSEIEVYMQQFANFAQDMNERLQAIPLDETQRNDILTKYSEMDSFFNQIKSVMASKKPHEDVGFSIDEVHSKLDNFKASVTKTFQTPPNTGAGATGASPKPQTEGDVDMKPEDSKAQ